MSTTKSISIYAAAFSMAVVTGYLIYRQMNRANPVYEEQVLKCFAYKTDL